MACLLAGCAAPTPFANLTSAPLAAARSWNAGELVLRCTPRDAEVAVDGVAQGVCSDFEGEPAALKVGTRARRVEVKKLGFQTWESWLAADQTRVVMTVTLLPTGGSP